MRFGSRVRNRRIGAKPSGNFLPASGYSVARLELTVSARLAGSRSHSLVPHAQLLAASLDCILIVGVLDATSRLLKARDSLIERFSCAAFLFSKSAGHGNAVWAAAAMVKPATDTVTAKKAALNVSDFIIYSRWVRPFAFQPDGRGGK